MHSLCMSKNKQFNLQDDAVVLDLLKAKEKKTDFRIRMDYIYRMTIIHRLSNAPLPINIGKVLKSKRKEIPETSR